MRPPRKSRSPRPAGQGGSRRFRRESRDSTRSPAAASPGGGPPWSAAGRGAARPCWPWNSSSMGPRGSANRASSSPSKRPPGNWPPTAPRWVSTWPRWRRIGNWPSITSASSGARSRNRGSTTSRASSSGSGSPSIRSGPGGSRSTPWRCSSPGCPTRASCGPSCAGYSAGSRRRASPRSSPPRAATMA